MFTANNALLSRVTPAAQQAAVNSQVQLIGQIGRAIGPLFATEVYAWSRRLLPGSGTGANAARLYMMLVGGLGLYYPLLSCKVGQLYGEWSDPSPREMKGAAV